MKFAKAHYIFSYEGEIFKSALFNITNGNIVKENSFCSPTETAFTVFYNGIICPNFWNLSDCDISQVLYNQQREHPQMTIFEILNQYIQNPYDGWIAIEEINLQTFKIEQRPLITSITDKSQK